MSDTKIADYFYNVADWDCTHHDVDTLVESADVERYEIIEVGQLVEIERTFFVKLPDPDDDDCDTLVEFSTEEEAVKAVAAVKAKIGEAA